MPPRYLRRASPTRLKPCNERMVDACDNVPADQCCGVIPCTMCLEWETYSGIEYGTANFVTSSWTGTVGGISFVSYWQRNDAGECEYVVTFGGYEVYRATCYEGASCRNPAGEVETTVGNETGTLRWQVYQSRELQLIDNPDTGCKDFFCGSCRCSCECVCVTITEYSGDVITGELCDIGYECDAPVWAGAVGYYDLSFALGRDQYGECIVTATVNEIEYDAVSFSGCANATGTIVLQDGTTITLTCKRCSCEQTGFCPCCPGWPESASGSIAWTTSATANDCEDGSVESVTGDFSCTDTQDPLGTSVRERGTDLSVRLYCDSETGQWKAQYRSAISGGTFQPPISTTWADATDVEFICPDCANAVDGQATGTVDFIAQMACETSGGVVQYDVLVHGEITIGCP